MAKITIDGKEYDSEALSEEARNNLQNIQVCEQKIADLKGDTLRFEVRETGKCVDPLKYLTNYIKGW